MKIVFGIIGVLLLAVFSVAYLYFSSLTVDSRSNDRILEEIPADASIIYQFSNDKSLFEIFKDYPVFDDLTGIQRTKQLDWLREHLLNNAELSLATGGQKIFLSFHPSPDSISSLWMMPLREDLTAADIAESLSGRPDLEIKTGGTQELPLLSIRSKALNRTFHLFIEKGIARGSFSEELLSRSIDKDSEKISPEFAREINASELTEGNALSNIFINHGNPKFLTSFFKQAPAGNFALFNGFSGYGALSMNYKSNALIFNGISTPAAGTNDYLNLFLHQKVVKNTMKRVLPYNLSNSVTYGLSDYGLFHNDLKSLLSREKELDALNKELELIQTETGVNADRDIRKLWGNEFSSMQLSTYENLVVIRTSNGSRLDFFLEPLSAFYSDVVRKMNYANLFYYYFGEPLKRYSRPFYAITDNMLIVSNSPVTVHRFLDNYHSGRFLYKYDSFTRFDQLVADQSNISFLFHFGNSESLMKSLLRRSYLRALEGDDYGFGNFYGISYQLSSNNEHFFTNFYLGYKETEPEEPDSDTAADSITAENQ